MSVARSPLVTTRATLGLLRLGVDLAVESCCVLTVVDSVDQMSAIPSVVVHLLGLALPVKVYSSRHCYQ